MITNGKKLIDEGDEPYYDRQNVCKESNGKYEAANYGLLDLNYIFSIYPTVTNLEIKQALYNYGAISCGVAATTTFQKYSGEYLKKIAEV